MQIEIDQWITVEEIYDFSAPEDTETYVVKIGDVEVFTQQYAKPSYWGHDHRDERKRWTANAFANRLKEVLA